MEGQRGFIYVFYTLSINNFGNYDTLYLFGGCFPIGQAGNLSFMPLVKYICWSVFKIIPWVFSHPFAILSTYYY